MMGSSSRFVRIAFVLAMTMMTSIVLLTVEAEAQIAPGAVIPLDLNKPMDSATISKIVNTCMAEESLVSFVSQTPNSTLVLRGAAMNNEREDGDTAAWTKTTSWYPQSTAKMTFDEWTTPTNSIKRTIEMNFKTETDYYYPDRHTISASVVTNSKGKSVNVRVKMEMSLPHFEIVMSGGKTCSINNWGVDDCQNIPESLKEANLVIPTDFVSTSFWVNDSTEHKTQKLFDTFKYAECLQNAWSAL